MEGCDVKGCWPPVYQRCGYIVMCVHCKLLVVACLGVIKIVVKKNSVLSIALTAVSV